MSIHPPRVSIGLPVFNGEDFLAETLDSILAQTFTDFELIISDNASTDRTQEICQAYAAHTVHSLPRIRYFRNETNLGAARNYNYVFELSRGEYFKWAAHDDPYAPEYLERCVEVLENQPEVVLCYPKTVIIDETGKRIRNYDDGFHLCSPTPHERFRDYLRTRGQCNPVFGLIRRSSLAMTSLIGSYVASDKILLGQLALLGQLYEVPGYYFSRRIHSKSSVWANPDYNARMAWFDPKKKRRLQLIRWRRFFENFLSIKRAQISGLEKTLCYFELAKWHVLHPKWIVGDFLIFGLQMLGNNPMQRRVLTGIRSTPMAHSRSTSGSSAASEQSNEGVT